MGLSGLSCGKFMRQKWRFYESSDNMGLQSRVVVEIDGTGAIEAATADIPQPWREAQT